MANRNRTIVTSVFALATGTVLVACNGTGSSMGSALGGSFGGGTTSIGSSIPAASQAAPQQMPESPQQPASQEAARSDAAHGDVAVQQASKSAQPSTVTNPYPIAKGDTFNYTYASLSVVRAGSAPESSSRTDGTVMAKIEGSAVFNGATHIDERSVLAYTFSDDNGKTTGSGKKTTDSYKSFDSAGSGLDYDLYGSVETDASHNSAGATTLQTGTVKYANPYILDELPETAGATWSNLVGYTSDSESTTTTGSVVDKDITTSLHAATGAYSHLESFHDGGSNYVVAKRQSPDGAGQEQHGGSGDEAGLTVFGTPVKMGSSYVIPVTYTAPGAKPVTTNVPDWYPGNGPISALLTAQTKDVGLAVDVPAKCGIAAGQPATRLEASGSALDVIDGTYTVHTTARYVIAGMGVVCTVHESLLQGYDNRTTGALIRTERIIQTSGLTSESGSDIKVR